MAFSTLETAPRITRIRVYTVVQKPPEFSWSPTMPKVLNTDTIVRLTDDSGQDGISSVCTFTEHGVDNSVLESMRPLLIGLLGAEATVSAGSMGLDATTSAWRV